MAFAALTVDLNAKLAKFEQDMAGAKKSMDSVGVKAGEIKKLIQTAFAFVGVDFGLKAFKGFIDATINTADHLNDLNKITGVSVSTLAGLSKIAEQSGTDLDTLAKGISRLGVNLENAKSGNENLAKTFKQLGIEGTNSQEAFFKLADRIAATTSAEERNKLVTETIGKKFLDLIPILSEGGDALRKTAQESESFAQAMERLAPDADKFNDNLVSLKENSATMAAQFAGPVVKSINDIAEAFRGAATESDNFSASGFFGTATGNALKGVVIVLKSLENAFVGLALGTQFLSTAWVFLGKGEFSLAAKTMEGYLIKLKERAVEVNKEIQDIVLGTTPTATAPKIKVPKMDFTDAAKTKKIDIAALGLDELQRGLAESTKELEAFQKAREDDVAFSNADRAAIKEAVDANNEYQQSLIDNQNALQDLIDPTAKYIRQIAALEKQYEGVTDPIIKERLALVTLELQAQADAAGGLKDKIIEVKSEFDIFAENLAKGFQDTITDFLVNPFKDGTKSMLQSFGEMIQKMIAQAVAADLTRKLFGENAPGGIKGSGSGILGGVFDWFKNIIPHANGGVMTSAGPMRLNAYASGGIANSTQFAMFGEGSKPEAFVPLPDGRRIPVAMQGGGGHTINVYVNGNNPPDVRRSAAQGAREGLQMINGAKRYG